MGYPRDLDDYTTAELETELRKRTAKHNRGECSYCSRKHGTKPECRYPERHSGVEV